MKKRRRVDTRLRDPAPPPREDESFWQSPDPFDYMPSMSCALNPECFEFEIQKVGGNRAIKTESQEGS